jgi:hypothetical protein
MSKSDPNPRASVSILDEPSVILKKFKSAVTDSEASIRYAEGKDGINNLLSIYAGCTGLSFDAIEREFAGKGYGDFKVASPRRSSRNCARAGKIQGTHGRQGVSRRLRREGRGNRDRDFDTDFG